MGRMTPVPVPVGFAGLTPAAVADERRSRYLRPSDDRVVSRAERWCEENGLVDPVSGEACPFAIVVAVRHREMYGIGQVVVADVRTVANRRRAEFDIPLIAGRKTDVSDS